MLMPMQRYHSSSNYVRRVAEDIVFGNDTSFKYSRAQPVPVTSSGSQAWPPRHVLAAAAVAALWGLLA